MDPGDGLVIIATWAAAIATAVTGLYAGWQASVAHSAYEMTKQIHRDQNQPYVFADVRSDEHQPQLLIVLVRNQGPTVAKDITVAIEPPLASGRGAPGLDTWSISAMTPGAQLVRAVNSGANFFDDPGRIRKHVIRVTAVGPHGPTDPLRYEVDLAEIGASLAAHKTLHHVAEGIEKIHKAIGASGDRMP